VRKGGGIRKNRTGENRSKRKIMKRKEGTEPGKGWRTKNWREVYRSRAFFYKKNG